MKKVLVTGVSSGIGRELVKDLNKQGYLVVGVARRKELLESLKKELPKPANFNYIQADLESQNVWTEIIKSLKRRKFIPDVVIFNAATWDKKLMDFNFEGLENMYLVNFLNVMQAISLLLEYCKGRQTHFIAISTLSALWGSSVEGVGYPASKAALSIAFEGLYQKFKNSNFYFTTISFGPIKVATNSLVLYRPFQIDLNECIKIIEKAIQEKKPAYFTPSITFYCFNLLRLLPTSLRLKLFGTIEHWHPYYLNKRR